MKPSQLVATIVSLIVLVGLISWGTIAIPQYRARQKYLEAVEKVREEEARQAQSGVKPEFYTQNPFVVAPQSAAGPRPKLEIGELIFEHGEMILGQSGKHAFVVKNVGNAPLKIAKGPMECKCTIPALERDELPPGESTELIVEFTPTEEGVFIRHNIFWTNDPVYQVIKVGIHAEVLGDLTIQPALGFDVGEQAPGKDVPLEGRLLTKKVNDFEITRFESTSPNITFDWTVDNFDETLNTRFLYGYRLKGVLKTGQEAGLIRETVTFQTTFPGKETITLPVIGSVQGPMRIISPYWNGSSMRIDLKDVKTDVERRFRLTMFVKPGPEGLKLLEVKAVPEFLKLELRPEGKNGEDERYVLEVIVPAGAPDGVWDSSTAGEILLKTNHPGLAELRFKVVLTTFSGR